MTKIEGRTPDFIIAGAMKCGTTTLHSILAEHPDVFIPEQEVHYFDMDDIIEHSDFNMFDGKNWSKSEFKCPQSLNSYLQNFTKAKKDQIIGEDSTTYFSSSRAFKRISSINNRPKVLLLLRNPVQRAYSQYWHLVRSGRATTSFENTLQYNPSQVLYRSLYLNSLNNMYKYFSRDEVLVLVFEEFVSDIAGTVREVCKFLQVNFDSLPNKALEMHENANKLPRSINLQLFKNNILRKAGNLNYLSRLDNSRHLQQSNSIKLIKAIDYFHRKVNPLVERRAPPMSPATKQLLINYFRQELDGINEILKKDVMSLWFGNNN